MPRPDLSHDNRRSTSPDEGRLQRLAFLALLLGLLAACKAGPPALDPSQTSQAPLPDPTATTATQATGATTVAPAPTATPLPAGRAIGEGWQTFTLTEAAAEQASLGTSYLSLLNEAAFSMGLYTLPGGGADTQTPHGRDEIYVVVQGQAKFQVDDQVVPATTGSILYVRSGVDQQFQDFRDDFQTLVFFTNASPDQDGPAFTAFHAGDLQVGAGARF